MASSTAESLKRSGLSKEEKGKVGKAIHDLRTGHDMTRSAFVGQANKPGGGNWTSQWLYGVETGRQAASKEFVDEAARIFSVDVKEILGGIDYEKLHVTNAARRGRRSSKPKTTTPSRAKAKADNGRERNGNGNGNGSTSQVRQLVLAAQGEIRINLTDGVEVNFENGNLTVKGESVEFVGTI